MLSENQVKRVLAHCTRVHEKDPGNLENKGWCQALSLVLEKDTYPIRKDSLDGK
jgi:hypothetical protein